MPGQRLFTVVAVSCALLVGLAGAGAPGTYGPRPVRAQPDAVYVPETGHTLRGAFLAYWRDAGGAASFGFPITEEREEDGSTHQYFQFARFELRSDGTVRLGEIGSEFKRVIEADLEALSSEGEGDEARDAREALRAFDPVAPSDAPEESENRRYVRETKHTVQWGFKQFWEATGEADYLGNPISEEYVRDGTAYQLFERGQLGWKPAKKIRMVPVGERLAEEEGLDTSKVSQGDLPDYGAALFVAPPTPTPAVVQPARDPEPDAEHWIEINLTTQYLVAWQGEVAVLESYISTGKPGFETPSGDFHILTKLESEDMEGVVGGEYYNVPAVPWVMYFTSLGHALHGTYWHANFGAVMSHGCVNLPMDVAAWLYDWAPIGARVEVHA
jgi:hypothetical protein